MNSSHEPFSPPSFFSFLEEEYWALHEAAFVLTEWPKYDLFLTSAYDLYGNPPNIELKRSFFYFPQNIKIIPKIYGKIFEGVFNDLKEAIENNELSFKTISQSFPGYFVRPKKVITWAILKGYILPKELQSVIGICQDSVIKNKTLSKKVREKIVAQFFLAENPNQCREHLCEKVLDYLSDDEEMYPKRVGKRDLSAIREKLNELYDAPGKKGPRKKTEKYIEAYTPKPIHEVIKNNPEGNFSYNFPLFKEAMKTAVYFTINLQKINEMNVKNFLQEFVNNEVVALYLQENDYILGIIIDCIDEAWNNFTTVKAMIKYAASLKTQQ